MTTKKKAYKFPKKMGTCADRLYEIKQQRLDAKKIVDALEAEEKALKQHIIDTLPKSEASGVAGKVARVSVITKEIPQVKNWSVFYKYVKKNGAFDLMQRRLNTAAVNERLDNGEKEKTLGIEIFNAVTVSLNKI